MTAFQFLLFCLVFLVSYVSSGKYAADMNVKKDKLNEERPFRINKLNIHWQTARKSVPRSELPDLYTELTIQDKMELEWKRRKADGGDEEGEEEAALRKRLNEIMRKFGLKGNKDFDSNDILGKDINLSEDLVFNKKLAKLWKKAQLAGFSEGELEALKTEFMHHQQKIDEVETLKSEIEGLDDLYKDLSENSVDRFQNGKDTKKLLKEKHGDLKTKYKDLKKDFEYLETLHIQKLSPGQMEFRDPKVIELWVQAQKANFSDEELLSFKEELRHFEIKLKKHEMIQREAEMASLYSSNAGKMNKMPDSQEKLDSRVKEYSHKMKKIHTDLKMKINSAMDRTEL